MGTWTKTKSSTDHSRPRPGPRPRPELPERRFTLPRVTEVRPETLARERVALSLMLRPDRGDSNTR